MNSLIKLTVLGLFFFIITTNLLAQNRRDFGIWTGTSVSQKLYKKLSADFQGQVRLDGNAAYFKGLYFDFGMNYKFHDIFAATVGYRYTIGDIRNTHRVYGDLTFTYAPQKTRTTFKFRFRGQYDASSDMTKTSVTTLRPRLFVNYNPKGKIPKKFNFYATGELFYEISENFNNLSRYRVTAGMTYDLNDMTKVNLRYIYQDDLNRANPVEDHILSLGLIIELPKFKSKKKKDKDKKDKDKDSDKKDKDNEGKEDKDKKKYKGDDKADDLDKDKN